MEKKKYIIWHNGIKGTEFGMTDKEYRIYIDKNTVIADSLNIQDDGTVYLLLANRIVFVGNSRNLHIVIQ